MLLDVVKSREVLMKNVEDVSKLIRNDDALRQMSPEFNKILCTILVIRVPSCTPERSLQRALCRLKTYTRSIMSQTRLNDVSIIHVHRDEETNLDKNRIIDDSRVRKNTSTRAK